MKYVLSLLMCLGFAIDLQAAAAAAPERYIRLQVRGVNFDHPLDTTTFGTLRNIIQERLIIPGGAPIDKVEVINTGVPSKIVEIHAASDRLVKDEYAGFLLAGPCALFLTGAKLGIFKRYPTDYIDRPDLYPTVVQIVG